MAATPVYKIVELAVVTDETLEETINHWVGRGWQWDGVRFVVGEASRRPQMAFVSFVRRADDEAAAPRPDVVEDDRPGAVATAEPRKVKRLELGELDLGEAEPLDVEVDWSQARSRRRRGAPAPAAAPRATKKRRR